MQGFLEVFLFYHVTVTVPMLRHVHPSLKLCNLSNLTASINNTMYKNRMVVNSETEDVAVNVLVAT